MNNGFDFIYTYNTYLNDDSRLTDLNSCSRIMVDNQLKRSKNFRITAYNNEEDISIIVESTGKFDKLKDFMDKIEEDFNIYEAQNENYFFEGNIPISPESKDEITLIACAPGKPQSVSVSLNDKTYSGIKVGDKYYIPLLYAKNTVREH